MGLLTKFSGRKQLREGHDETGTFRYDDDYDIQHDRDLITKEYIDPIQSMLAELLPPDAESLQGKALTLSGTSLKTGYLSSHDQASYEAGKAAGSSVNYLINDATYTLSTPNTSTAVNQGDNGVLACYINNVLVDSIDLASRFNETNRNASQTGLPENSSNGKITVISIQKYDISLWQKITARLNIVTADLRTGYNEIVLKHTGTEGGDQVSQIHNIFYDTGTTTPTLTVLDATLNTISPKWLSGVKYAGIGSTIHVDAEGTGLYDNSYLLNPITLTGFTGAPTAVIAPTDGSVSGLSNPPIVSETMTVIDKQISLSSSNKATKDARITGTPRDPFGAYGTRQTPSHKILVNTFTNRSNNTTEHFDSEDYRLPLSTDTDVPVGSATGNWDSEALLVSGNLQQGILSNNENGLLYPAEDFTPYLPENTADYDAFSGHAEWMRAFVSSNAKQSVALILYGLSGGIGSDVIVEIKLPNGNTGWLRTDLSYDSGLGVQNDGNGCLIGNIIYSGGNATINCTFGGKNTFASGMQMFIRIRYANANRTIKQIGTNW